MISSLSSDCNVSSGHPNEPQVIVTHIQYLRYGSSPAGHWWAQDWATVWSESVSEVFSWESSLQVLCVMSTGRVLFMRCWQLLPVSQAVSPNCCSCTEGHSTVPGHPTPPQKLGLKEQPWVGQLMGGGMVHGAGCGIVQQQQQQQKQHMSSAARRPRLLFWVN